MDGWGDGDGRWRMEEWAVEGRGIGGEDRWMDGMDGQWGWAVEDGGIGGGGRRDGQWGTVGWMGNGGWRDRRWTPEACNKLEPASVSTRTHAGLVCFLSPHPLCCRRPKETLVLIHT